jgi:hypothetical protein
VPDDDLVRADKDFLDEQTEDPLALRYVESAGGGAQPREERGQRFGQAQVGCAAGRLIEDCLQFCVAGLFALPQVRHALAQLVEREQAVLVSGEQTLDALADVNQIAPQSLLATFGRVGLARGGEAAVELVLDELGIFEQADDFCPHDRVQNVLTNRAVVTDGAGR